MIRHTNLLYAIALAIIAFASCSVKKPLLTEVTIEESDAPSEVIPLEKALASLEKFLKETEGTMLPTKSMSMRRFKSIDTYYPSIPTKSFSDTLPTAYIVNFEDDEGFAVLGANVYVDDIVAVTESGSIDPETLWISFADESYSSIDDDSDPEEQSLDTVPSFSEEDEDYYSISNPDPSFVRECIMIAIHEDPDATSGATPPSGSSGSNGSPGTGGGSSGMGTTTSTIPRLDGLATVSPLLNYSWGQGSPYNEYCFRRNLVFKRKSAVTGCSTTAMAMIVAANRFPHTLTINDSLIVWADIMATFDADDLEDSVKNQVALLMGSIYNHVNKIAVKGATLITPEQIKKELVRFKYTNVRKYKGSSLNLDMINAADGMLKDGKPVFISAMPKNWRHGHSWVIDGAKYSEDETYLLHFNFGWRGACNGYFSTSCLNPTKGEEYDEGARVSDYYDNTYTWHFRLITYDIPSSDTEVCLDLEFDY